MKRFDKERDDKTTEIMHKHGAFFAFSDKQFNEQARPGVIYTNVVAGMLCPKENADVLVTELDKMYDHFKELEVKTNKPEEIILYELQNHECFYTGDIMDAFEALTDYGYTWEQVRQVYKNNLHIND